MKGFDFVPKSGRNSIVVEVRPLVLGGVSPEKSASQAKDIGAGQQPEVSPCMRGPDDPPGGLPRRISCGLRLRQLAAGSDDADRRPRATR